MQRQFKFRPSRHLMTVLIAAHSIALASLLSLALPVWAKVALAFSLLFSLGYYLHRDAWLSASAGMVLALEGGLVALVTHDSNRLVGRVLYYSLVTPSITVLNVLPQGEHFARSVVILPDSLDAESFRQLRVWLKWGI